MNNVPKVVLVLDTSRAFGRRLLLGITKYARLNGAWAFYSELGNIQSNLPKINVSQADGIIMCDSDRFKHLVKLKKSSILIIHNTEDYPGFPAIKTDSKSIAQMAIDHLISKGLKNFGFCGFDDMKWSIERNKYFEEILADKDFEVSTFIEPQYFSKKKWVLEQKLMAEWLTELPKPVGIMACNDDRAQHVIEACKIAQLKIPQDVSVIGVDNDDLICDACDPPLSSIVLDFERAGFEAAKLLDDFMNNKNFQPKVLTVKPTHIKVRKSTDVIATQDKELLKAINFIKQNFRKDIRVVDVVESTAISRRSLELRFREKLSRSINDEIRRIRIEHICNLLIETDLSISEIAYGLGFSSVEHISRYFQREIGKSPREFRKVQESVK